MPIPNQPPPAAANERIYTPEDTERFEPRLKDVNRERSELLQKIRDWYGRAGERLTTAPAFKEEIFLGAGLCFGLLDPAANIIYNALSLCAERTQEGAEHHGDMAECSLDGLVAFLTFFFQYLADWEAVRYLLLADADLVRAVRLAAHDRALSPFDLNSDAARPAVRTALMCAALASKHMDPHRLVRTWLSPVRPLEEAAHAIHNDMNNFNPRHHAASSRGPGNGLQMQMQPLDFAWKRAIELPELPPTAAAVVRYRPYQSLKFVLLQRIHTFYLKALALMPAGSRYHRSMIKAGHCYGPFDPVSNIIINTIWYNTVFPQSQQPLELDMISTTKLLRIQARSFYGLVTFLCTSGMNLYEAMRFLLISDCNLRNTAPFSNPLAYLADQSKICHAFRIAGVAAWHPDPVAHAEFISSCTCTFSSSEINGPLDSADIERITRKMFQGGPPTPGISLQHQSGQCKINWMDKHTRISKKIKAALASYALENREPYDLHVICGVNLNVSGPVYCMDTHKPVFIYHHIHVNFLASTGDGNPKLFFAELSNDGTEDGGGKVLCCPVNFPKPHQEQVRCLYCDFRGTKIVHPAMEEFQFKGGDLEFQNMACGIDPYEDEPCRDGVDQFYTNCGIIKASCQTLDHVIVVDDDTDDDTDEEDGSDSTSESE